MMKMKKNFLFVLAVIALAVIVSSAQAQADEEGKWVKLTNWQSNQTIYSELNILFAVQKF